MYRKLNKCTGTKVAYIEEIKKEEIDLIYTWVDSNNVIWKEKKSKAQQLFQGYIEKIRFPNNIKPDLELETSLLLTLKNLKWIRHIYIVTMRPQIPSCLYNNDLLKSVFYSGKLKIIHHDQIGIPLTFNSSVIECYLHKIPHLSDNFLYLNDDFFILQPVTYSYFFQNQKPLVITNAKYIESRLPKYVLSMYSKAMKRTLYLQKNINNYCIKDHSIPYTMNKKFCEKIYSKYENEIIENNKNIFRSEKDFLFFIMVLNEGLAAAEFLILKRSPFQYKFFNNEKLNENFEKYTFICLNNMDDSRITEEIQKLKNLYVSN